MKNLIKRMRKLNDALPELLACIFAYFLIVLGIGMIFSRDKAAFALGLSIGVGCAVFMAVHMALTIDTAVSMRTEKQAAGRAVAGSVFRYAVVFIVLALVGYFGFADLIAAFIGVMGLKLSAYAQPFVLRFTGR